MINSWKDVFDETYMVQKEIKRFIENYDYSDDKNAKKTDATVCNFLIENFEKAKDIIQEIINITFELYREEDEIINFLNDLQDNIDNIITDIKSRPLTWEELSKYRLKKIIIRDSFLIIGVQQLLNHLDILKSDYFKMQDKKSSFAHESGLDNFLKKIQEIKKEITNLETLFREREDICISK